MHTYEQAALDFEAVALPVVGHVRSETPLGLDPTNADTRFGSAVSHDLLEDLRSLLEKLRKPARQKLAAVALAAATGMSERSALFAVQRIANLRDEHGETDPDIARRLNPPRRVGSS